MFTENLTSAKYSFIFHFCATFVLFTVCRLPYMVFSVMFDGPGLTEILSIKLKVLKRPSRKKSRYERTEYSTQNTVWNVIWNKMEFGKEPIIIWAMEWNLNVGLRLPPPPPPPSPRTRLHVQCLSYLAASIPDSWRQANVALVFKE